MTGKWRCGGDDVLGFDFRQEPPLILKTEAKSRVSLTSPVVKEACDALCRHLGRPNPSTLSFISRRLRESGNHERAEVLEALQESEIQLNTICHLIFSVSGNDPTHALTEHSKSPIRDIKRELAGCINQQPPAEPVV